MRLLSRLEYARSFGARWVTYFARIPKYISEVAWRIAHAGIMADRCIA